MFHQTAYTSTDECREDAQSLLPEKSFWQLSNLVVDVWAFVHPADFLTSHWKPQGVVRRGFGQQLVHLCFSELFSISIQHLCHDTLVKKRKKMSAMDGLKRSLHCNVNILRYYLPCTMCLSCAKSNYQKLSGLFLITVLAYYNVDPRCYYLQCTRCLSCAQFEHQNSLDSFPSQCLCALPSQLSN